MEKRETRIQIALATWVKLQYPTIIFTSESSGIRVPMGLAMQMKKQRSNHTLPDFMMFMPKGQYHGLFLELKKDRSALYKKNGDFRITQHIIEQNNTITLLNHYGYFARFACGLDQAMEYVNWYMKQ
jgi:hypothetical protein